MKYVQLAAVIMATMVLAQVSWAGGACCASKKSQEKASMSACAKATSGLDLTAEQQAKVAEIEAACQASGSTAEACQKAKSEIRELLSDDQKAKFDAAWDKASGKKAGGGCG